MTLTCTQGKLKPNMAVPVTSTNTLAPPASCTLCQWVVVSSATSDGEGSLSVSKVVAITLSLFFVLIFAMIIVKIRKCFSNSSQTNSGVDGSNPNTNISSEVALATVGF
ncbi:uncharacterized protein LOC126700373 [Quercus robur]|uniref:uncharacterized protein LOC126700373 n=1 Tax=Quercus robur TaxID=38942 RepID=UPI0021612A3E|nr:uncharacterized protein LOC126700373 [Quercus robur]